MRGAELEESEEKKVFRECREVGALIRYDPNNNKDMFPWKKASLILA